MKANDILNQFGGQQVVDVFVNDSQDTFHIALFDKNRTINRTIICVSAHPTGATVSAFDSMHPERGIESIATLKSADVPTGFLFEGTKFEQVTRSRWSLKVGDVELFGDEEAFAKLADMINYHLRSGGEKHVAETASVC